MLKRSAYTLIEVLMVIAVISLLTTILLPSVVAAMELARRVRCGANLKAIGVGLHLYADDQRDFLPYVGQVGWGQPWTMPATPEMVLLGTGRTGCEGYVSSAKAFTCPSDDTGRKDCHAWQPPETESSPWPWREYENLKKGASYEWSEQAVCGAYDELPGFRPWQAVPLSRASHPTEWGLLADGNAHVFNAWFWGTLAPGCPPDWNRRVGQSHIGGAERSVNVLRAPGDVQVFRRRLGVLRRVRSSPVGDDPYPDALGNSGG